MQTERSRAMLILPLLGGILLLAFLFSFIWGRYDVPFHEVPRILLNALLSPFSLGLSPTWTENMAVIVINIRLPRILLACLVGGCLSMAGAAFQSVFQNPMAAPDILGASSGACFGAALAILLNFSKGGITALSFVSSLVTVALVYLIGRQARGSRRIGILLAGIMVGSLFSSATSYVKLVADPNSQLPAITYWLMGSLSGARLSDIAFVLWPMLLGAVPLLLLRWRLNLLTIPEEEALSMGVRIHVLRLCVILCATLLTASAVSVSGMIGWVGLVIPHLSRKLVGHNGKYLLPASLLMGALFLLLVDNLSRNLLAAELPIGILTACVGAPFFLYLMTRKEACL